MDYWVFAQIRDSAKYTSKKEGFMVNTKFSTYYTPLLSITIHARSEHMFYAVEIGYSFAYLLSY
jgi:hypothetical protein